MNLEFLSITYLRFKKCPDQEDRGVEWADNPNICQKVALWRAEIVATLGVDLG